jgi:hypothetical protein
MHYFSQSITVWVVEERGGRRWTERAALLRAGNNARRFVFDATSEIAVGNVVWHWHGVFLVRKVFSVPIDESATAIHARCVKYR